MLYRAALLVCLPLSGALVLTPGAATGVRTSCSNRHPAPQLGLFDGLMKVIDPEDAMVRDWMPADDRLCIQHMCVIHASAEHYASNSRVLAGQEYARGRHHRRPSREQQAR